MKRVLQLHCLLMAIVLICACVHGAYAAPSLTKGDYTAYLGENNHLFTFNKATNMLKTLSTPIEDILSMDDTQLYCLASGGVLYGVRLDGTGSSIIHKKPTDKELQAYQAVEGYTLKDGALNVLVLGGTKQITSGFVTCATVAEDKLFYAEITPEGILIKCIALSSPTQDPYVIGPAYMTPAALFANDNALIILGQDGRALAYNLDLYSVIQLTLPASDIQSFAIVDGKAYCYQEGLMGNPVYAGVITLDFKPIALPTMYLVEVTPEYSPVPTPEIVTMPPNTPQWVTAPPQGAPTPQVVWDGRVTPSPTKAPAPPVGHTAVKYGQSGSRVLSMQKRLAYLDYPVGSADGYFGNNTLRALHLFQEQSGYSESSTATSSLLNKLFGSSASYYDAYKGRQSGNSGERVKLLQERLWRLGYRVVGVADGYYGYNTLLAVEQFQKRAGLDITGIADRETMMRLYAKDAPEADDPITSPTDLKP